MKNDKLNLNVVVSMTTIPSRKERLITNLPAILEQSYDFHKLVINVDDNLTEEDYKFYDSLKDMDNRIMINKADAKWRSCNKLLPTIKLFPESPIITVDDDIYYPRNCFFYLVEQHLKTPQCVVAHEINPISVDDNGYVNFYNNIDIKLRQIEWGKYLSNCALFPPHTFDGTDLYDYDKMMYCTNGNHDELWFWVQSVLNGVQCVGLDYIRTFHFDNKKPYEPDEYRLTTFNDTPEKVKAYMDKINEMYGEKMVEQFNNKPIVFILDKNNVQMFSVLFQHITNLYPQGFKILYDDLTSGWVQMVRQQLN